MSFPKLQWWQWCLLACATFVFLLPAGLAAMAPALAPLPASTSVPKWEAPSLPDRVTPLPGFQDLLDSLPLVVRDLPDQASQDVVAAYDRATLFDPQPSRDMLAAAERAVPVPSGLETAWNQWVGALNSDSGDPAPIPDAILEALRNDPRNGDRLSNLAVAIYFTALKESQSGSGQYPAAKYRFGVPNALRLLGATSRVFPGSRAPVLNYAFLSLFYNSFGQSDSAQPLDPKAVLATWSAGHPDDVTALQLLVSGHLSHYEPLSETTLAQLNRLAALPDAPHAALGYALLGDLKLSLARSQSSASPFMAQQTARLALQEYDRAIGLSDDSSVYFARAVALEFLGDIPAAIVTQRRAVALNPDSVPLRILLAELCSEQQGDESQVQAAMREARDTSREALALAASQQDPLLSNVQIRVDPELYAGGNRRDVEYTAFRPARTYLHLGLTGNVPGGAAGYIISYNLIPKFEREPKVGDASLPAERAAYDAIVASVILGDPHGAAEDADQLQHLVDDPHQSTSRDEAMTRLRQEVIPAAQLVADRSSPTSADIAAGLDFAVIALRYAGIPARAAALCRAALDLPQPGATRSYLLACVGENAYLADQHLVAHQAFAMLEQQQDWGPSSPLKAAMVAQVAGDRGTAIRLFQSVATNSQITDERGVATTWLGDIQLSSGDAAGAIGFYDQAIQVLGGTQDGPPAGSTESTTLQHVRNNRGVARLMAWARSGGVINCTGRASTACVAALADFEAALRSDPYNPVSLMGKAWVQRLLGHQQEAAQTLKAAVQVDPTLFPAWNDVGVLAAQSGDIAGARQAFQHALAVNPTYDLALWNLGVLEMQRGVTGVPQGQAYLARAIRRNPSFASSGPSYRFDNGVYRVEFSERNQPGVGWSFVSAYSIATTAFGLVTVLVMLMHATKLVATNKVQDALNARAHAAAKWVQRSIGYNGAPSVGSRWGPWLPLLVTLPALAFATSWPALRGDPKTASAVIALALFAALTAVITHELGHVLVAWLLKARVRPAQWGPGTLLALVLLPANMSAGPFPAQRVLCEDEQTAWWVYLSGPLSNLLIALGAYVLFSIDPLPGMRLIALAQVTAMSYALLPFEPLDGAALSRSRPTVLRGLASFVLATGVLFTLGVL